MKCILVDDEPLALNDMERQLRKLGGIEICGKYSNAQEALDALGALEPNVVFLDIDMPVMNGLEAALHFQEARPAARIVFVTAYQEYAIKAFELNALDYLLKPVLPQRLEQTLRRLEGSASASGAGDAPAGAQTAVIRCFRSLSIEYGPSASQLTWRTNKAQELFAFLLHRRGQQTRKDTLIELLWPELEPVRSYALLYTTVYQLRKSIEAAGLQIRILNTKAGYELVTEDSLIDVDDWERRMPSADESHPDQLQQYESWLEDFTGDYLEEQDYEWADTERRRLRLLWYRFAVKLAALLEEHGMPAYGLDWLYRVQERFPYSEEIYFLIMKQHASLGENSMVEQQYALLAKMSEEQYGHPPSADIAAWYAGWRADGPAGAPDR
ncbi:response regulator [Cohnella sp. JJ-181]|uniref:response regulator n=1 Tax=Cohnella rhizoplanae TaxID=2974897 RepID=UPI0022FF4F5F|nr:response regulator [Cohnella sp. JJ-181]CAI6047161.1 Protein-glutamate methylesterase/protein-glutamine glutaminase [Cohnella sp. JJ-181]